MTIEFWVGVPFGMWIMVAIHALIMRRANKAEQDAPEETVRERHKVTVNDEALACEPLVWEFATDDERKAFTLGVEAGRDVTITALKARNRIAPAFDFDFQISSKRAGSARVEP